MPGEPMSASEPVRLEFYMYRAVNNDSYHMENVNLANLAGVMVYMSHEVGIPKGVCRRKDVCWYAGE